ncbi:hypothetical protein OAP56_04125 [Rickettsiaceae bacterium]|nr:hypothetical protein [Rickettsiaceae bacterium]
MREARLREEAGHVYINDFNKQLRRARERDERDEQDNARRNEVIPRNGRHEDQGTGIECLDNCLDSVCSAMYKCCKVFCGIFCCVVIAINVFGVNITYTGDSSNDTNSGDGTNSTESGGNFNFLQASHDISDQQDTSMAGDVYHHDDQ